ncbi:MAG: hypothetical protein DMF72_17030 [Acidobacteria bacterium]|nr:MAG: hypothetical protein DMF72_17030 [Acidobacteriota bacterium]
MKLIAISDTQAVANGQDERDAQIQHGRGYRLGGSDDYVVLMNRTDEGANEWKSQYRFKLKTYSYSDYAERCRFHLSSPDSHFTQNRICSMLTSNGRISVSDTHFIVSDNGARRDYPVTSQAENEELLRKHFGIFL